MAEMPWSSLVSNTDVYGCFSAYHCLRNFRHLLHSSSSFYHFLRDVLMITSHCFSPENFYFSSSEKFFVVEFERQWPLNTFGYCKGIPISTNICVCSKRRIWPFRLFLRLTLATLRAVIFSKCCSLLTLSRRKRWLLREPPILDVHKRTCALFTLTKNKKKEVGGCFLPISRAIMCHFGVFSSTS